MKVKPAKKQGNVVMEVGRSDTPILAQAAAALPMKRVLVPVDFSDTSLRSVAQARAMARQFGGSVVLLHVVEISYSYADVAVFDQAALERDLREGAEQRLDDLAAGCRAEGVPAETHVRMGRPARVIAEAATEHKADLIVISTHGYTGLKHVLLGSTAENVVRYAPCPVLVLRGAPQEKPRRKG